jgi:hypothetical protein
MTPLFGNDTSNRENKIRIRVEATHSGTVIKMSANSVIFSFGVVVTPLILNSPTPKFTETMRSFVRNDRDSSGAVLGLKGTWVLSIQA